MRIRFGSFDFDPATRELRRDGIPVHLQGQPAQVLALLLAHPGEVVTREALRTTIWDAETFVDFDRGLNFCIAQIRSALGDSASSPIYVKTLPKRGYQFIAPVAMAETSEPETLERPRRNRWPLILGILTAAVLAALLVLRPWNHSADSVRIAIARFDNQTNDPDFERFTDGLTDAVIAEFAGLDQGKYAVIGNAAILRQPRSQRDLLAIHSALKADLILLGEVQRNSDGIYVFAQLITLPSQVHLKAMRIRTGESDPLRAQSELAKRILHDMSSRLPASHIRATVSGD
jgi:DNA-binding winged helix-turn-helix (wHTH) protein/TolB-like protein